MSRRCSSMSRQASIRAVCRGSCTPFRLLIYVRLFSFALICLSVSIKAQAPPSSQNGSVPLTAEPITPIPVNVALDAKRVALGERLFNDVRLSGDNTRSCTTCHPLHQGAMDNRARAVATDGRARLRNTPTLFNVALNFSYNWDGATTTLQTHNERLLGNPAVMNAKWPVLLTSLRGDSDYVKRFGAAFPDGLTQANVLNALAEFEHSLITPNAPIDRYLRGDRDALTADERKGYRLFKSYGCIACHQGLNIGGNLYQKFGVFQAPSPPRDGDAQPDVGRYRVTSIERDRGVFRVPSLRNVAVTAPYFHDGRAPTLESAVEIMGRVQLGRELAIEDINAIVRFLRTLTGEYQGKALSIPTKGAP
jgi:cytochrome c peroxidase